jgi:V8-like Glu-specific endopeptidase
MGASSSKRRDELYPINGFKRISLKILKSICKLNTGKSKATGFFLNSLNQNKYLITNNHVINRDIVTLYSNVNIEIYDGKCFNLDLNNIQHYIKFYEKPIDITIIKIDDLDEICSFVEFLDIDYNIKKDYKIYLYENVFTFGYPLGNDIECAPGKIVSISDKEFLHNCDTERGFSGSPIILASNSKVIGVHKEGIIDKKLNAGTLLGIIGEFTENKDNINIKKNKIFNAIDKMNIKIMQMKKSICIIETENNGGTGFLCLIEGSDKNLSIPALFTCHHVLNKTNFRTEIKLIFYDKEKTIKLDESRIIFSDRIMDITCIKLKKNEYDINDYLRIDEDIFNKNEINRFFFFKNKQIYIISFPYGNQSITEGRILNLKDNNSFYHNCSTDNGSSGAPILNSDNMKVIGIHVGIMKNYNLGTIIPKIIKQSAFNLRV